MIKIASKQALTTNVIGKADMFFKRIEWFALCLLRFIGKGCPAFFSGTALPQQPHSPFAETVLPLAGTALPPSKTVRHLTEVAPFPYRSCAITSGAALPLSGGAESLAKPDKDGSHCSQSESVVAFFLRSKKPVRPTLVKDSNNEGRHRGFSPVAYPFDFK